MFNPNEEIQIIGVDLGDNPDLQTQYIVHKNITELNKKLELKNRYEELLKRYELLEEQVEIYKNERDTYKRLAEVYIEKYNKIKEEYDYDIYELGL